MATTIKLKNGSGAPLAGDLVQGEPALDLTNKRLYTENASGTVIEVGTNPSTLTVDTDTLVVDAGNNRVGIGTTSPSSTASAGPTLEISGTAGGNLVLSDSNATTGQRAKYLLSQGGALYVGHSADNGTSPVNDLVIDSSGNVGIGTTNPNLHGWAKAVTLDTATNAGYELGQSGTKYGAFALQGDGRVQITNFTANPLTFQTNNTEQMRIDSSGNLLVNSTSAGALSSPGRGLIDVDGTSDSAIELKAGGSTYGYLYTSSSQFRVANLTANPVTFFTNNIERMRIDSSGNLGLGNNDPSSYSFDTGPDIIIGDGTDNPHLSIVSPTTGTGYVAFADGTTGNEKYRGLIEYAHTTDHMGLRTGGSERMRITSAGNVGIGTTSPDQTLHVHKGSAGTVASHASSVLTLENSTTGILQFLTPNTNAQQIRFGDPQDNGAGLIQYDHATSVMQFNVNGPERMRIDSSGNVGIGTNVPVTYLSNVSGSAKGLAIESAVPVLALKDTSASDDVGYIYQSTDDMRIANYAGGNITFSNGSGFTERMRIDSSGALLIGRTSGNPNSSSFGINFDGGGRILAASNFGATDTAHQFYGNAGSAKIAGDGDLENTNNSYGGLSDARLKSNIVDASSQIDDIMAVQVRSYTLNETGATHIGVVAQELEASGMSGLVKTKDDGMKSVKYSILYIKAIKALQEAVTRIETLEAEVAALKGA